MSKEQKPLEELIDKIKEHSYKWSLAGDDYIKISHVENIAEQLLTKEKEQREEMIKKVCIEAHFKGSEMVCKNVCIQIDEEYEKALRLDAEEYYNEVIKPKHLNK